MQSWSMPLSPSDLSTVQNFHLRSLARACRGFNTSKTLQLESRWKCTNMSTSLPSSTYFSGFLSPPGLNIRFPFSHNASMDIHSYLKELINPQHTTCSFHSTHSNLLHIPRTNLKTMGDRAICVAAPHLWNALPDMLSAQQPIYCFKTDDCCTIWTSCHLCCLVFILLCCMCALHCNSCIIKSCTVCIPRILEKCCLVSPHIVTIAYCRNDNKTVELDLWFSLFDVYLNSFCFK